MVLNYLFITLQLIAMVEHESGYVVNYMYTTDTQLIDRVPHPVTISRYILSGGEVSSVITTVTVHVGMEYLWQRKEDTLQQAHH